MSNKQNSKQDKFSKSKNILNRDNIFSHLKTY